MNALAPLTYQQLSDMRRSLKGFLAIVERAMVEYDLTRDERCDTKMREKLDILTHK